jgi:hypothetical protein
MSNFELTPIEASESNARHIQRIVYEDFLRLPGMTEGDALSIANPDDETKVKGQYDKLQSEGNKYFSVDGMLAWLGVVKFSDWYPGDEQQFMTLREKLVQVGLTKLSIDDPSEPTMGLHVFARSNDAMDTVPMLDKEMLGLVVKDTRSRKAGYKTLKCAVDQDDIKLQSALDAYRNIDLERRNARIALGTTRRTYDLRHVALD